jgi:plastocyanin
VTPAYPGPAFTASAVTLVQPRATPAPGGGPTSYPLGTVFATGKVKVTIGPGGRFTPDHVYLRPGTVTEIVNADTVPHTFVGFNGATDASGPIPPGGSTSHQWEHPGTWTFHDTLIPNAPVFTVTDVPED